MTLRTGFEISLPPVLQDCLDSGNDLETRTLRLAFDTIAFCAHVEEQRQTLRSTLHSTFDTIHTLDKAFSNVHDDLIQTSPYLTVLAGPSLYPSWYSAVSRHPGEPSEVHVYLNGASDLWNNYRMSRLKFQSTLRNISPELAPLPLKNRQSHCPNADDLNKLQEADAIEYSTFVCLIDEICSSVYPVLTGDRNGKSVLTSFAGVSGARALALVTPLNCALSCLKSCDPELAERILPGRLSWLRNVLEVLGEKAGIREAWCWTDDQEAEAKARIREQLWFAT